VAFHLIQGGSSVALAQMVVRIDFDDVDATATDCLNARPYLARFGIRLRELSPGTMLAVCDARQLRGGKATKATSQPNLLTQCGGNEPTQFVLDLSRPVTALWFTRPLLLAGPSGITHPEWSATALDESGSRIAEVSEGFIQSLTDVPKRRFVLRGNGIRSVRFRSNGRRPAAFGAMLLDDLRLQRDPLDDESIPLETRSVLRTARLLGDLRGANEALSAADRAVAQAPRWAFARWVRALLHLLIADLDLEFLKTGRLQAYLERLARGDLPVGRDFALQSLRTAEGDLETALQTWVASGLPDGGSDLGRKDVARILDQLRTLLSVAERPGSPPLTSAVPPEPLPEAPAPGAGKPSKPTSTRRSSPSWNETPSLWPDT